ncbi:MAG: phospho-N-acetylmuramoyl-pentapeptide-transferase [Clostridia bacterium]|nr:phospho-N-acetylmuramoyl-pentapeptide-transferase [Clostridia bacterium]
MRFLFIILGFVISFIISALLGIKLVPALKKFKMGQITEESIYWHKAKKGTPTMGGIMFIFTTIFVFFFIMIIDSLTGGALKNNTEIYSGEINVKIYAGILLALSLSMIGFMDDYLKVKKNQNEGLSEGKKTVLQILVIGAYITCLCLVGQPHLYFPMIGSFMVPYWLYIVLSVFAIYGTVNAVNFVDGIDGLCSSVSITSIISLAIIAYLMGLYSVTTLAIVAAGSVGGFLIWNAHPAKCFMGDTGSMFLGGMISALCFAVDQPIIILLVGIVFFIEALTVFVQRIYFKLTKGNRLPFITPIHHEFEKRGFSENKIVLSFTLFNLIFCIVAILLYYFSKV